MFLIILVAYVWILITLHLRCHIENPSIEVDRVSVPSQIAIDTVSSVPRHCVPSKISTAIRDGTETRSTIEDTVREYTYCNIAR